MWKKTITLTTIFLFLISTALAYKYVATKGNRQVWADDIEAHNSINYLPFKFCNLNPTTKNFKPTIFLDLPIERLYYWGNKTDYGWKYWSNTKNITKWQIVGGINTTYQEIVSFRDANWTAYTYPGWVEVGKTESKGKKKEATFDSITFAKSECKELKALLRTELQSTGKPSLKYDLGENKEEILDPLINNTDYQSNFSLDLNTSLTTATIQGAANLSNAGNGTYTNTSDLWAMWPLDEAAGAGYALDSTGRGINMTVINPVNWTFGVTGSVGTAGQPNGSGLAASPGSTTTGHNGFLCSELITVPVPYNLTTFDLYATIWSQNSIGLNHTRIFTANNLVMVLNASRNLEATCNNINDTAAVLGSERVWSKTQLALGTKYHIALTYNGTQCRLFLDGIDDSYYNITSPFAIENLTNPGLAVGGEAGDSGNWQCTPPLARCIRSGSGNPDYPSICTNATFDQVRWRNTTQTSFGLATGRGVSNHISLTNNITRYRAHISSSNAAVTNVSISFDASSNYTYNITNNTVNNWTNNRRNSLIYTMDYTVAADAYYVNITLGSPSVNESILTNRNITHNSTLNLTFQCSDGLPNPTFYYYDNTSLFNINTNTGAINYDPTQAQTGNYQIGVTCEQSNYNTTRPFNLTIFNSAINVTSVNVNPSGATATDTLRCDWTGIDSENDADAGSTYRWYVNNLTITATSHDITTGYTTGDYVNCEVLGYDGLYNSTNYVNSSGIRISTGGGTSGGSESLLEEAEEETKEEQEETPLPVTIPLYSQSPEPPPLEDVFKEIPPPETCGDKICSQSENAYTCSADCPFDLDVIFFEMKRLKCLTERNCQSNTNFIATLLLSIFLGGLVLFLLLGDKEDKKKKKRR